MGQSVEQQLEAFRLAFVLGAITAVLYFIESLIRELFCRSREGIFICDYLFMTAVVMMDFIFSIAMSESRIRFYVIAGQAASFGLLHYFIGRRLIRHIVRGMILIKRKMSKFLAEHIIKKLPLLPGIRKN